MQNKCNCQNTGFVPVSGNWDFGMNGDCGCDECRSYDNRSGRRSNNGRRGGACADDCIRNSNGRSGSDSRSGADCRLGSDSRSSSDCQCERCDDSRNVECCDQNTYVRDMDDCECSGYTRNRSNGFDECDSDRSRSGSCDENCGCEKCIRACGRNNSCSGHSNCGKDNGTAGARTNKNRGVGMLKGYMQEIDEIFQSESALRAGTLFPELHKPLNGYCPCDENCGTCAQAAAFAAWELRLYLNTHPDDEEAIKLFRKLCKEAEEENYATTFLTDDCCTNGWNWVRNPWPWEYDCACGD